MFIGRENQYLNLQNLRYVIIIDIHILNFIFVFNFETQIKILKLLF